VVSLDTSFFSTNTTDGFDIAESNENTITLTCLDTTRYNSKPVAIIALKFDTFLCFFLSFLHVKIA
jgi:hypothetical protein